MASYFDEHNCEPLGPGEQPDHLLHLARLLIDGGFGAHFDMEYHRIFPDQPHKPPASKQALQSLKRAPLDETGKKCPICLKEFGHEEFVTELPCCHFFHDDCIIPWLKLAYSCGGGKKVHMQGGAVAASAVEAETCSHKGCSN
ncbi:hypothetical protein HPB50_001165 [Hyalomma asiaticum]|uniref:Uncharacterized protein n=1 Tax=Hyalomma asiaticum TaxID=266040 RepID=A0ACB7TCV8_HYAAI|nr:hypothetical protein HPB50_001165 [Hyalomma asiaticum]